LQELLDLVDGIETLRLALHILGVILVVKVLLANQQLFEEGLLVGFSCRLSVRSLVGHWAACGRLRLVRLALRVLAGLGLFWFHRLIISKKEIFICCCYYYK
jgi:hypothetical protein